MRQIKFRAWTSRGMVYDWLVLKLIPQRAFDDISLEQHYSTSQNSSTAYYVMQFTGLHDKNGKEIYEADILLHITTGERGVIKYAEGAFYCDHQNLSSYSLPNINNCKVIGNIHENLELLERKANECNHT